MSLCRALRAALAAFAFLCFHCGALGQTAPNRYWVQFEGKLSDELPAGHSTPYTLDAPAEFLSPKAIYRRALQNIAITAQDLPIPPSYVDSLRAMDGFKVILQSKWFNAVTIAVVDTAFDPFALLELLQLLQVCLLVRSFAFALRQCLCGDKFKAEACVVKLITWRDMSRQQTDDVRRTWTLVPWAQWQESR